MIIKICEEGKTRVNLWLPNFLIKCKFVAKIVLDEQNPSPQEVKRMQRFFASIYKSLKAYVKKHGHFTMVEMYTAKGEQAIIRF